MNETTLAKLSLSALLSPILVAFDPYATHVWAIGLLVIIDIASGMAASKKEGIDITSERAWPKVVQVGLFFVALAAARAASPLLEEFSIQSHQAGKWFCALYGLYELLSILENLGRLGLPVATQFLSLLKSKLPKEITDLEKEKTQ